MKCRNCGEEITIRAFGAPKDVCFECYEQIQEDRMEAHENDIEPLETAK